MPRRLLFIDNLRWTMIILVISMHAADTYSPLGNWYYSEKVPLQPATLLIFATWQMFLQSFFMGLLFFIAGFFTPASFDRKGPLHFARERAFRLGVPVLFYMFILGPITEYFVARSWTSSRATSFVQKWLKHIRTGEFLQENGPLWFCLALLIFSLVYAAFPKRRSLGEAPAPRTPQLIAFALMVAGLVRNQVAHGRAARRVRRMAADPSHRRGIKGEFASLCGRMALAKRRDQSVGVLYLRSHLVRTSGALSRKVQRARGGWRSSWPGMHSRFMFSIRRSWCSARERCTPPSGHH